MAFIYSMIAYMGYYTPMHSDDFPYATIGIEPARHINHYMTWSGRVVADYVSTLILMTNNHLIVALINSMGSALLIYNIASLPASIDKDFSYLKRSILSVAVFFIYWTGNPNLGQVMFWVVGSANYMWTTLCIIFMLRTLIKHKEFKEDTLFSCCYLFIISLIAGCTNENTSITAVAMVFAIGVWYRINDGRFHKGIISSFLGVTAGAAIMILAPGNFARAGGKSLEAWRSSPLSAKIKTLMFDTLPDVMAHNKVVFAALLISALVVAARPVVNKKSMALMAGFILCFMCANIVMVAAPGYPPRTMNGQFIFLLCSFSMLVSQLKIKHFIFACGGVSIALTPYFISSYYSMVVNYKSAYAQSFVRTRVIEKAIKDGKSEVSIPNWSFSKFSGSGQVFDTYHSPWMYLYYGNGIKKITVYPVGFDYSVISDGYRFDVKGFTLNGFKFKGIYAYHDKLNNQSVFVAESECALNENDRYRMFIKPVLENGEVIVQKTSLPFRTISVDGRNFTYVKIEGLNLDDVNGVDFGYYNTSTGKIMSSKLFR